ncbi:hypothetical protein [Nostoc sp. TCL240-02]|uniref:hypothetical protein n=1 Tax=Nostoc sp. TCL240-02 TaxID=2572090 RepID=UPI00157F82AE|nr:hypothetical protein [Nostoc sp. TCL240-02]
MNIAYTNYLETGVYKQPVTQQMLRCWKDEKFTTEQAASGITFVSHFRIYLVVPHQ